MKLVIAEKPELGKAIAKAIGNNLQEKPGYIEVDNNYIVTWQFGHMLELKEPQEYDIKYKNWSFDNLPFNINKYEYKPKPSSIKQLNIIKQLIHDSRIKSIISAGDVDAEGEILIRETITYCKNNKPCERVLIPDLVEKSIKQAFNKLEPLAKFNGIANSGFSRSFADWEVGLNLTRAYTLQAKKNGYDKVITVGRVQTPILALIVNRYNENKNHKENFYYSIFVKINSSLGEFKAHLSTKEQITNKDEVDKIVKINIENSSYDKKIEIKSIDCPLPFNLVSLQTKLSKEYGFKPDYVLEITQGLREKHKLITYNRSDCQYLPENHFINANALIKTIKSNLVALNDLQTKVLNIPKCFNDKNITAHHAIIPTEQLVNINLLNKDELIVYKTIALRYLQQFLPNKQVEITSLTVIVEDYKFKASSNKILKDGWDIENLVNDFNLAKNTLETDDQSEQNVPFNLKNANNFNIKNIEYEKLKTKPKPLYKMHTLLPDLVAVSKYVTDPKIKELLLKKDKDKKGERGSIGTEATRSQHIKNLFTRNYIKEDSKKNIIPTEIGLELISLLPDFLTTVNMTALWFEQQQDIEKGNLTVDEFIKNIKNQIKEQIITAKEIEIKGNKIDCPACKIGYLKRNQSKDKKGYYWICSNINGEPSCPKKFFPDDKGKPLFTTTTSKENDKELLKQTSFICCNCDKKMKFTNKVVSCDCGLIIWRNIAEKKLTDSQIKNLLKFHETEIIKGFKSKTGKVFSARLTLVDNKVVLRY